MQPLVSAITPPPQLLYSQIHHIMKREIFKNAPLAEMIVEVRWRLTPVSTVPNGGVDPFHDILKKGLEKEVGGAGYSVVQEMVPPEVPREFLAGQPTTQYRKSHNVWPLFQLGPGVFTINITDEYSGWQGAFRNDVVVGLEAFYKAHPAHQMLHIETVRLIAIDAFSTEHGYKNYLDYSKDFLNLGLVLPKAFVEAYAQEDDSFETRSETIFRLKNLDASFARVSIGGGKKDTNKALVLQTTIETKLGFESSGDILEWLDSAHLSHREMFRSLLTEKLRDILDPKEVDNE